MAPIAEPACAKVNLTLRVLGRRADGYHSIESLVVFADAADRLTLDPDRVDGFAMDGPTARTVEGDNLVARVLALAREAAPELSFGHLHLEKLLPVAAGIGGGSADAAAAIRAILQRHPDEPRLRALANDAKALGADVPACLVSRALVMRGIGEEVTPLRNFTPVHAVLVNPRVPLATAAVFKALAAPPSPADTQPLRWPEVIKNLDDLIRLIADRPNHLEPLARTRLPVIGEMLAALNALPGCRLARMSGSGPTCFGLFDRRDDAQASVLSLSQIHAGWWVTATTLA